MEFSHTPLDLDRSSFRLARLKAGQGDEPIACELIDASFEDDVMDYEAVSYTWGDVSVSFDVIWLNGGAFHAGYNLWSVLHDIRYPEEDRIIWIDAICIDQASHGEKNHQVQQMRRIYGRAHRVIFWVGPLTSSIWLLMDWLAILQNENPRGWPLRVGEFRKESPEDYSILQHGLSDIFSRPWFQRVWILQEVANARAALLHCGSRSVSAKVLPSCPKLFDTQPPAHCQAVLDVMPGSSRLTSWWSHGRDVFTLLRKFAGSGATREHDKIYALRGLCDSDTEIPQTNYMAPISSVIEDTISAMCGCDTIYLRNMFTTFEQFSKALDTVHNAIFVRLLRSAPYLVVRNFHREHKERLCITEDLLEAAIRSMDDTQTFQRFQKSLQLLLMDRSYETENEKIHLFPRTGVLWAGSLSRAQRRGILLVLAAKAGYRAAVQILLDAGVSPNWASHRHDITKFFGADKMSTSGGLHLQTALHVASTAGPLEIVELLLNRGANINIQDGNGRTALHVASTAGSLEIVELLLNRGANVNIQDGNGRTALHDASTADFVRIAELLLDRGADIQIKDGKGRTPLDVALLERKYDLIRLLQDVKAAKILKGELRDETTWWDWVRWILNPWGGQ